MSIATWVPVPEGSDFPVQHLPYGIFSRRSELARVGVAIGDHVLDLAGLSSAGLIEDRRWFAAGSLNAFMGAGRPAWQANRRRLRELLTDEDHRADVEPHLVPMADVQSHLPVEVADYVDFYSSRHHATNVGRLFRPHGDPLAPNWLHLPVGYHGRAGTVVPSGTPVIRPCGQHRVPDGQDPAFGPSARLDVEVEVGFVVGVPSQPGQPVPTSRFREHTFGFVLVNDWSARDIQAWEAQPLGPFLGKSFATSISQWVTPVDALEPSRVPPPDQDPAPLPYLRCAEPWGLDLELRLHVNDQPVSRPRFDTMYWTPPQQLAHATVNGAWLRTGDLFASGTVSGPERHQLGCLLELTGGGAEAIDLPDGTSRTFLEDGDTVHIGASARGEDGTTIGLGQVAGTVYPAVW